MADLYRPSCGTEGADFFSDWCCRCKADAGERDGTGDGCRIYATTLMTLLDESGYPTEWRYERGEPVCTGFDAVDPLDVPFLRSAAVRDLFPGLPRRPAPGEGVRMMFSGAGAA